MILPVLAVVPTIVIPILPYPDILLPLAGVTATLMMPSKFASGYPSVTILLMLRFLRLPSVETKKARGLVVEWLLFLRVRRGILTLRTTSLIGSEGNPLLHMPFRMYLQKPGDQLDPSISLVRLCSIGDRSDDP